MTPAAARYVGRAEHLHLGRLIGWAWDHAAGRAPAIQVEVNGQVAAEITPDLLRPDLAKAGLGDGRGGFAWAVPPRLCDPAPQRLRLLAAADGSVIFEHAEARLATVAEELYRAWKQEALGEGLWALDAVQPQGERLVGSGWSVPPHGVPRPLRVQVNGAPAEMTWLRRSDPAITDPLGLAGRFERPRFRFGLPLAAVGDPALLHLSLCDPAGRPIAPSQDVWVSAAPVPQPPDALRQRVHGPGDAAGFDRTGCTIARLLTRALEARVPGGFAGFGTVLDWGCGCSRVGRYLLPALPGRYIGVDPDAAAIGWCRTNLPDARFEVIDTDPPLPFATGAIDCVIGVSVFTHLAEAHQRLWLAELERVLRPGGIALLTTFGKAAWSRLPRRVEDFLCWQRTGFTDFGPSEDLVGVIPDPGVYRGVSHAIGYVRQVWGQYFEILEAQDGGIAGYQDIILARRRG